jgi:DivIVA domain-containing protein
MGDHKGFTVVLRGYDPAEVDAVLERIREGLASVDRAERTAIREQLNDCTFRVRLRGYDRVEVDEYLRRAIDQLA